jgi:hypothetical protein
LCLENSMDIGVYVLARRLCVTRALTKCAAHRRKICKLFSMLIDVTKGRNLRQMRFR